jgi:hypothetical protein
MKRFLLNWAIIFVSFVWFPFLFGSDEHSLSKYCIAIYIFCLMGGALGLIFSIVSFIDDKTDYKQPFWVMGIIGGALFFTGIAMPVFYLKRHSMSLSRLFGIIAPISFVLSLIIFGSYISIDILQYSHLYSKNTILNDFQIVAIASALSVVPTVILGRYNMRKASAT